MGLIVPSIMHPEQADQPLPYEWFVGIDWGSQQQQVCVLDRDRRLVGERTVDGFDHRVGHFRPFSIRGEVPKLLCPQAVRCFYLEHRLVGWPTP